MTAQNNLSPLIDALGTVRAQMAALEAKDKEIKEALASLVAGTYEGDKYKLTIIMPENPRRKINWETIARKLKASQKLIDANTDELPPIRTLRTAVKDDVPEVEI
jgi:hypothetical protein